MLTFFSAQPRRLVINTIKIAQIYARLNSMEKAKEYAAQVMNFEGTSEELRKVSSVYMLKFI